MIEKSISEKAFAWKNIWNPIFFVVLVHKELLLIANISLSNFFVVPVHNLQLVISHVSLLSISLSTPNLYIHFNW